MSFRPKWTKSPTIPLMSQLSHNFIDRGLLEKDGRITVTLPATKELEIQKQMLELATQIGRPIATRSGGSVCDVLVPTDSRLARPRSLSNSYSFGAFPFHNDTAHWATPCHYVMLGCVSPGSSSRPTLLLDVRRVPLTNADVRLLRTTPFRVMNGRNSFFSTILSKSREFVRLDRGCMTSVTTAGDSALAILSAEKCSEFTGAISWEIGQVLLIDNWWTLHARASAERLDIDRKLLRISIK